MSTIVAIAVIVMYLTVGISIQIGSSFQDRIDLFKISVKYYKIGFAISLIIGIFVWPLALFSFLAALLKSMGREVK